MPPEVKFEGSTEGTNWVDLGIVENNIPPRMEQPIIKRYGVSPQGEFRYVRMTARTFGKLPEWHLGAEHDGESWLFADEIGVVVR